MNSSVLAMVDDDKVAPAMERLREIDKDTQLQGLRAFVWNIEQEM
jgi:hypothetical protein